MEVKELDRKSAQVFASLLEEEGYCHYEARVMLAGEPGTGKTTIARYLVGKGPTESRISTDGIDLYNGLSFIDRAAEEWMNGKQDFTLEDVVISRSLRQNHTTSTKPKDDGKQTHEAKHIPERLTDRQNFPDARISVPGESVNLNASTYMATKEPLSLENLVLYVRDETQKDVLPVEEENKRDASFVTTAYNEPLPTQNTNMRSKHINKIEDFTLEDVVISRSLRQNHTTSTKPKDDGKQTHEDKHIPERLAHRQNFPDARISVPNESGNLSAYTYMATKEQLSLENLVLYVRDETQKDVLPVEEENKRDASFVTTAYNEPLPTQNTNMRSKHINKIEDFTLEDVVISRSLRQNHTTSTKPKDDGKQTHEGKHIPERLTDRQNFPDARISVPGESVNLNASTYMATKEPLSLKNSVIIFIAGTDSDVIRKPPEKSFTTEVVHNPGVIGTLKKVFGVTRQIDNIKVYITKETFFKKSLKAARKKLNNNIVPVIIWDFGGQDVFYSTHQTFLTYRAIYLIVLDGRRTLDDPCPYQQYLPGKSGTKTARDYLRFWINAIVTYCKGSGKGFPKIMIVLSHKDVFDAKDVEARRKKIFHDIKKMFIEGPLLPHLLIEDQIFVNARNKNDPEMVNIKKIITKQAMQQVTWGQELPKCFIPLELEFDSLLSRKILLITMEHMRKINLLQPVRPLTENELNVFLKFQHSVGRIIYFDVAKLDQHIILAPTHLIDAFKSIVTDRIFCKGNRLREDSWDLMSKNGVIGKKSIEDIWKKKYQKFQDHKDYLLAVMTHLDILVELNRYDGFQKRIPTEFYYVASMVRTTDETGYLRSPSFEHRNIAIAFSPSSSIIPPALSFRFISYCLSIFAVKKYGQRNDEMLFHRSAVFTIDPLLDMCVNCDDEVIIVRLVHLTNRTLIIRDLASSIKECLAVALDKISQLYVKTGSSSVTNKTYFNQMMCCSSSDDPCFLPMLKLPEQDDPWICHKHGIEHTKAVLSSWNVQKLPIKEFFDQSLKIFIYVDYQCSTKSMKPKIQEQEKWNLVFTEEHLDRVAPLVGNNSLSFLVELGMEFKTWEKIKYTQREHDLVKLNRDILEEWKYVFCSSNSIKPTLRLIGQAFNNIGKNIRIIENVLADLF
ncbi:unnamed protein product [Mytilus coruscus]|uniref:COR domain-containing protein n=1 Tax=Mytilus coruscus TaxID=42192 RepID=A0A6J8BN12_MYTCO|nr:unnamed protein product [Mytilus coruscus]